MALAASFEQTYAAARTLYREGRHAEAVTLLRHLLLERPEQEKVHDFLMLVLHAQGRRDEAMAAYRHAVRLGAYPASPAFDALYEEALIATGNCPSPLGRRARLRNLHDFVSRTADRAGCAAECGCFQGMSSYLILATLRSRDPQYKGRDYHVFDSFQGLSAPTEEDDVADDHPNAENLRQMCRRGAFSASLAEVRRALGAFPEVEYHPGWIPLTFRGIPDRQYRFVHVDLDLYDPILSALEYFCPRLAPGGMLVCDDYSWPGARRAIEEYCGESGLEHCLTADQQAVIERRL